jgi:subtilisin family serine protease
MKSPTSPARRARWYSATLCLLSLVLFFAAGCTPEAGSPLGPGKGTPFPVPIDPIEPGPNIPDAVPQELMVRLADAWDIAALHELFSTWTIDALPAEKTYLIGVPAGIPIEHMIQAIQLSQLCTDVERNYYFDSPETEQECLAFYEGDFDNGDYVDQEALIRIGAMKAHAISTGTGVLVAIIDTGVDLDHPELAYNVGLAPMGYDWVDHDSNPSDQPNYADDNGNGLVDEATGHGSHVAGIVVLTAPDVAILPLRALDSDGTGTLCHVTWAVYSAIEAGADVINMSLGMSVEAMAVKRAIQKAHANGILVTSSAGNRGIRAENHFPASMPEVVAVTATTGQDMKALFANYGSHISMAAPGVGIMSSYWNGGYAIWSGTSMAAPFIAGAAALLIALEPGDPDVIQQVIEDTSVDIDEGIAYHGLIGKGRVDLLSMVLARTMGTHTFH